MPFDLKSELILIGGFSFGKMWKDMENQLFFEGAMAGLGK